ncbi:MAG: hypothetical protein QM785_03170 [Pyrinomonadaceae bacterium]
MATLTIKNLPDEIYAALSEKAKRSRRSINNEAIIMFEESFFGKRKSDEKELEEISIFRDNLAKKGVYVTTEILNKAKNERRF